MGDPLHISELVQLGLERAYYRQRAQAKALKIAARPKPTLTVLEFDTACAGCGKTMHANTEAATGPEGVQMHRLCLMESGWSIGGV